MINPFFDGTAIATSDLLRPVIIGADQIENLAYSSTVGPGSSFASGENGSSTHVGAGPGQFLLGVEGYMGYAFEAYAGGPTMYGVMRITIKDNDAQWDENIALRAVAYLVSASQAEDPPGPGFMDA